MLSSSNSYLNEALPITFLTETSALLQKDMEFHLLPIFLAASLGFSAIVAYSSSELDPGTYWHSVLPNIPIPASLQELIPTPGGNKGTILTNGQDPEQKKGIGSVANEPDPDHKKLIGSVANEPDPDGKKDISSVANEPDPDRKKQKGSSGFIFDAPDSKGNFIFDESYRIFKDTPGALAKNTLVYKYNTLNPGTKMTLFFSNSGNKVNFLPRKEADSIPFETKKLQQILQLFSVKPESPESKMMNVTLSKCDRPNLPGEVKFCATSLESLVDFNVLKLGKKQIRVISTPHAERQEYSVVSNGNRKIGDRAVVCHRERYPYAVFYCHSFSDSDVHQVSLVGADGTKVDAVTLCHMDTAWWNPNFFGFRTLGLKPGQPICHFLNADGLVWYRQTEN